MILRFEFHVLVDELCAHYRRSGFFADRVGAGLVEVGRPGLEDPLEESRAVVSHLRAWEELHPEAHADVL